MSLLDVQSEQLAIKLQKEADAGQGMVFDIAGTAAAGESQAKQGVPSSADFSALGVAASPAQPSAAAQVCDQPVRRA